jgi:acetyl-CoA carboxylase alpha subunit
MTNEELEKLVAALRYYAPLAVLVSTGVSPEVAAYERGRASAFATCATLLENYLYPTQDGGCNDD